MSEKQDNLLEQFMRFQWLLGLYYHHNNMAYGPMGNPHRGQGRVLKILKMQPEITQRDLSELLDMRPQSLGELLAKLERTGYITRTPLESDKRVMMIRLTEKGMAEGNQPDQKPDSYEFWNCLSEDEQDNLSEYLNRMIGELQKQIVDEHDWHEGKWYGNNDHESWFGFEHNKEE